MCFLKKTRLILTLCLIAVSSSHLDSSRLQIHIPKSLQKKDGYDHREATFGIPPYGGSIQQNVYYAGEDNDLCATPIDTRTGYPQRPSSDSDGKMQPWPTPFILMIDRGHCAFATKVRNAQKAGAVAALIADTKCLCAHESSCTNNPGEVCETTEPIMADDGSTEDIVIPSFLMFKQDADKVKETVKNNQTVRVEMSWSLPSPNKTVNYELWFTPTDPIADFLTTFDDAAKALGSRARFTPHMFIYDGNDAQCVVYDENDFSDCDNLCTNGGRYCALDPDQNLLYGSSGADVVTESLRRECIWNIYGLGNGIGTEWWDYVQYFIENCNTTVLFKTDTCISAAMKYANIDSAKVAQCMEDSGGLIKAASNTILDAQLKDRKRAGVVILPVVYVNDVAIRGYLDFAVIFKAVCAGFSRGHSPDICEACVNCKDEYACVQAHGRCPGTHTGISAPTFIGSLLAVSFLFGVGAFFHHRRSQRQVRDQVKAYMAEYMPVGKSGRKPVSTSLVDDDDYELAFQVS